MQGAYLRSVSGCWVKFLRDKCCRELEKYFLELFSSISFLGNSWERTREAMKKTNKNMLISCLVWLA